MFKKILIFSIICLRKEIFSTTKELFNPRWFDYFTLVASSGREILPLEDKYYFSQLALTSMTRLSVPNSSRSGVDIYWTNLSAARVLYFEFLTKPTVRLNQIPKYPENFWRGESNRWLRNANSYRHIFLFLSFLSSSSPSLLFLSFPLALCVALKLEPSIRRFRIFLFFRYCFHSIDAWRFIASLLPCEHPAIAPT